MTAFQPWSDPGCTAVVDGRLCDSEATVTLSRVGRRCALHKPGAEDQLDKPFLLRVAAELDNLLILGPIPDPPGRWAGTQGDWYWPYLHGQDIDSVSLGRVHDKGRLWWIFGEEPHTTESAWLQPILCNDGSKVSVDAYRAGRSARFEHGESGASQ